MEDEPLYYFSYSNDPFTFSVTRASTGEQIINTNVSGMDSLVFEEQYLEMTFEVVDKFLVSNIFSPPFFVFPRSVYELNSSYLMILLYTVSVK